MFLGVVDATSLDAMVDVRAVTRDAAGGAGLPGDYARPSHHFETQGLVAVDFDAAARLAVVRRGPHVAVFSGFPPGALFAMTLYAGGEVSAPPCPRSRSLSGPPPARKQTDNNCACFVRTHRVGSM